MSLLVALIAAFVVGAIAIVAVEAAVVYFVIRRIVAKSKSVESATRSPPRQISGVGDLNKGVLWILEPEKVPKIPVPGELNRRRESTEVFPVPRFAKIKGKYLILTELDGSRTKIMLKGCKVVAVSATGMSSRKWNKRYPIKVESNNVLYCGSKILYLYTDTSWEKDSWCKALRVASCDHNETLEWFSKIYEDFICYLRSLTEGYPSFVKPSGCKLGPLDRTSRLDSAPSKVRLLWKKLARKASKSATERKTSNIYTEDNSSSSSTKSVDVGSHVPEVLDTEACEKIFIGEGTLCWNLLISRLFFDAKSNSAIKNSLKARIQRTLSNMRTPSYIGALTCTDIDPGNLPPHIRNMRVIPTDMNEMWALEMDIEYVGDLKLFLEVRLEVHDKYFQNGTIDPNVELSSAAGMATDILQGFENLGEELNCSDGTIDLVAQKNEGNNGFERVKSFKSGATGATSGSKWKSIVNSVAKQVSEVPFILAIRVASLRGTMQLHVKHPPSDQLWFGFTSMPDVDFHLESFVGEHKITNAHISSYLVNRFKAAIRGTLVFPNCESLCIPWMLAEKEDWVPKTVAPLIWLKRDVHSDLAPTSEVDNNDEPDEPTTGNEASEEKPNPQDSKRTSKQTRDDGSPNSSVSDSSDIVANPSSINKRLEGSESRNELRIPLLQKAESPENLRNSLHYMSFKDRQDRVSEEDDDKPKRLGRKATMIDLGRKMSEKLEEKSRNIVDKMRRQ